MHIAIKNKKNNEEALWGTLRGRRQSLRGELALCEWTGEEKS